MEVYILNTDLSAATRKVTWYKQVPRVFFFALSHSSVLLLQLCGKVFSKHTVLSAGLT
jgi:hypothetical protein